MARWLVTDEKVLRGVAVYNGDPIAKQESLHDTYLGNSNRDARDCYFGGYGTSRVGSLREMQCRTETMQ
jgi:hypothetical protein